MGCFDIFCLLCGNNCNGNIISSDDFLDYVESYELEIISPKIVK